MAPSLRRTVAAATIAAAAAATAAHAAVDVYPYGGSVTAERLARAIVHKFQHTGSRGAIRYVKGSAELLGFDQDPPYPNKELQTGFVQTGEALLPESAGSAVCFTSGPISNLVTGNRDKFPTIDTFIITENYFSLDGGPWTLQDIIGGLQTFSLEPLLGLSDRGYTWGNSVALKFHVKAVESTTVTNEWAFCSNRPLNALTGAFDAGAIAYEGLGGTPARTLLNPGTFRNKDSDPTSCFSEFQDEGTANEPGNGDQYGLPKFTNALGVENAMYCTTRTSEFAVEAGEYYEIQYTASNQNGVGNAGEESAAFLFVASSMQDFFFLSHLQLSARGTNGQRGAGRIFPAAAAGFAPDYPDIYEPSDADWTGTETTQEVDVRGELPRSFAMPRAVGGPLTWQGTARHAPLSCRLGGASGGASLPATSPTTLRRASASPASRPATPSSTAAVRRAASTRPRAPASSRTVRARPTLSTRPTSLSRRPTRTATATPCTTPAATILSPPARGEANASS